MQSRIRVFFSCWYLPWARHARPLPLELEAKVDFGLAFRKPGRKRRERGGVQDGPLGGVIERGVSASLADLHSRYTAILVQRERHNHLRRGPNQRRDISGFPV